MKYRKKPIVIEATRWFKNGDHPQDDVFRPFEDTGVVPTEPREGKVVRYFRHPQIGDTSLCGLCGVKMHDHGWIDTLEGGHTVCPGDWVITGVAGERYPCKNEIFLATYEPAGPTIFTIGTPDKPATAEDVKALEEALQNTRGVSHLSVCPPAMDDGDDGIVPEDDTDGDEPQLDDPDLDDDEEEEITCPDCGTEYTGELGDCPNCPDRH